MSKTPTVGGQVDKNKKKLIIGKQFSRVTRILSRSESVDNAEDHLLEDEEPIDVTDRKKKKKKKRWASKKEEEGDDDDEDEEDDDPKLKIPSSLVTLTEDEKRQLEDVLMRIGLKECGL